MKGDDGRVAPGWELWTKEHPYDHYSGAPHDTGPVHDDGLGKGGFASYNGKRVGRRRA